MYKNFFRIFEIESQSSVERVKVNDGVNEYGYEPRCLLELKDPGRFSMNKIVGTLYGKPALYQFNKGDLVAVSLSFSKKEINNEYVTHVTIEDIKIVHDLNIFL